MQWNDLKMFLKYEKFFGKVMAALKLLESPITSTLTSYKLVSYKKERIKHYAIKKLVEYSLKKRKKTFRLLCVIDYLTKKSCRTVSK